MTERPVEVLSGQRRDHRGHATLLLGNLPNPVKWAKNIRQFLYMGVSINGGTPKWLVYKDKSQ